MSVLWEASMRMAHAKQGVWRVAACGVLAAGMVLCNGCNDGLSGGTVAVVLADETSVGDDGGAGRAATWPMWRGAHGDSVATDAELPTDWDGDAVTMLWQQPLGTGWSSPVVADGRVVVTDREGATERVVCFDAVSGELAWEVGHAVDFDPHRVGRRHGNGPKSTPAIIGGRVVALGIAGWLECLDLRTGERLWHVHLPRSFAEAERLPSGRAYVRGEEGVVVPTEGGMGGMVPLFGYTGSVLVNEERVVVSVGGARGGTMMAFDIATGEEAWRSLDENVSYSSPIEAEIGGVEQVVVMTGPRVVGLEAASGRLLWSHPFQIQYDESISTPTVAGELVMVTGDSKPLTALRISRAADGKTFEKSVAWTNRDLSSYLSSMVVHAGHVYGMNDGGEFACIRLADGETTWVDGEHGYYCSPVLADDLLLGLCERGTLAVVRASPDRFTQLAEVPLVEEASWTVPAVVGSRMYVRSGSAVRAFEMRGGK